MRILLTNDDGIHAPGLQVLNRIARQFTDDVWIVAPETDQSGLAHSLTLSHPLRARKVEEKTFAVAGTPTDCVIMAARHLVKGEIDLVLSGVNAGQNVGDHVTYSGTVAGAMEGTLLGIRSIALSQAYSYDPNQRVPWETCETLAPDLIETLLKANLPPDTLLNVNFPNCPPQDVKSARSVVQGKFSHGLMIDERRDSRGVPYYWLQFAGKPPEIQPGSDIDALRDHEIAVTPIRLDLTNHQWMDGLAELLKG